MKWCLSSRQTNEYLSKADEIRVEYRDRNIIYDLREKYKNATVILVMPFDQNTVVNWKEIETFNVYMEHNFILCLNKLTDVDNCKERDIKFYYGFPVQSFYEANLLKKLGVCYLRLGGALAFSLDKVQKIGIPIRAVPNVANEYPWPDEDGVCAPWIRPEDIDSYAKYISTIEFEDCDLKKEQGLYRLYAVDKQWIIEISALISNLHTDANNRFIIPDFGITRQTCGQKCQENGHCHWCHRCLSIANEEFARSLKTSRDAAAASTNE